MPNKILGLLLLFLESEGRVLSHEEIMKAVWRDTQVETANLKQSIYILRKILGESSAAADGSDENGGGETFIKTLPRRGYRFHAPARVVSVSVGRSGRIRFFVRQSKRVCRHDRRAHRHECYGRRENHRIAR